MTYMTRVDVANALQIDVKLAGKLMRTQMACIQVGRRLRVTEDALRDWQRDHTVMPGEKPAKKPRARATAARDPALWEPDGKGGWRLRRRR